MHDLQRKDTHPTHWIGGWMGPRTSLDTMEKRKIVHENPRLTVRSIAEQANIDRKTVRKIITEDIDMRKVCAKIVPKELIEKHCL
jgi:predicted regulator of amino acid metabolism with ACT domain